MIQSGAMETGGIEEFRKGGREAPLLPDAVPLAPEDAPISIEVNIADSPEEIEAAKLLLSKEYTREKLIREGHKMLLSDYLDMDETTTFVAKKSNDVVGTVSMVPGDGALPIEQLYKEELKAVRESGDKIVEIIQLATDHELSLDERNENRILIKLFEAVLEKSLTDNVDDLVIEINPKHEGLYTKILGFEYLGGLKTHPELEAPTLAKIRDLKGESAEDLRKRLKYLDTLINVPRKGH